jgi:mRNA-degrading endonuclease RelE of RelBE toxin-antitoxin system
MALVFRFRVEKLARSMPREDLDRLIERLKRIADDPYGQHADAKRRTDGAFQVRHGQWRAVYHITPTQDVEVIHVAHRREVNRP